MSTDLQKSANGDAVILSTSNDDDQFKAYLRRNLTSDLVLEVLEECLLEENSTYNPIDFVQALKDLQQKDSGRYQMLKALLEGFATKEGQVMLDPKLVNASYRQRVAQLETLKSMGRARRFIYRLGQALVSLLSEKSETEAIQEAIQVTGEVQIGRQELTILEYKKTATQRDVDRILTEASNTARKRLEAADHRATEKTEQIYRESRDAIANERRTSQAELASTYKKIEKAKELLRLLDLNILQLKGKGGSSRPESWPRYSPTPSLSPSTSPSPSTSDSSSISPSPSYGGAEDDDDDNWLKWSNGQT